MRRSVREVRALPARAKGALAVAVALIVALAVWAAAAAFGGSDGGSPGDAGRGAMPTTTLATGGLDIDAPTGWQEIPIPSLGVGLAIPPGWEAVRLDAQGLASLAGASPQVSGFVESAHDAAELGGVFYAAGEDAQGRVSDLMLRGATDTGVTDDAGLETYAAELADDAGWGDVDVAPLADADRPTVRVDFRVGDGDEVAEGSEVLVLGDEGVVWLLEVTSDDADIHDDLVTGILDTLTLGSP